MHTPHISSRDYYMLPCYLFHGIPISNHPSLHRTFHVQFASLRVRFVSVVSGIASILGLSYKGVNAACYRLVSTEASQQLVRAIVDDNARFVLVTRHLSARPPARSIGAFHLASLLQGTGVHHAYFYKVQWFVIWKL